MFNLKKSLVCILNHKNYKYIIFVLITLILSFLLYGNYNFVEGLTLQEMGNKLEDDKNKGNDRKNLQKKQQQKYENENINRSNIAEKELKTIAKPKKVAEGFFEGMSNCSSNHSNLGLKGNKSNLMVNSQCENIRNLKHKNK